MTVRRLLWLLLIASLVTMLLMLHLNKQVTSPKPAATASAPGTGKLATTQALPAERPPVTRTATASASAPERLGSAPASQTQPAHTWRNDTFPPQDITLGSLDKDKGYKLQVELTNAGSAVKTVKLTDYFATLADKKRHGKDPATYQQAVAEDGKLKGNYTVVAPAALGSLPVYSMTTQRVGLKPERVWLELSGPRWQVQAAQRDDQGTTHLVSFASQIYRDGQPYLRLEKTYSLRKDSYSLDVGLKVVNLSAGPLEVSVAQLGVTGVPREDLQTDRRALCYGRYDKGSLAVAKRPISEAGKLDWGLDKAKSLGRSDGANPVVWTGLADKFFAALLYVRPKESGAPAAPEAKAEFFEAGVDEPPTELFPPPGGQAYNRTYATWMNLGPYELAGGDAASLSFDLFAGPKLRGLFDGNRLYTDLRYKDTLDFGGCFFTWAPLTLGMMWLLDLFARFTFGNYGLAIMLLVVLVRLALHPLTKKSQVSMLGMQKLQPEMARLKEKYKDDKAKLNEETMKLYKTQGATPILGCLPMFLQMPIWIALWTGLSAAAELRQAPFLPFWLTDLAAPDKIFGFGPPGGIHLPLLGSMVGPIRGFNLLPILLTIAMFLQQKYTPTTSSPGSSDQQGKSQKQMMYFMSGFFMLMFYNAPSGLTLYIMTSTFAGVAESIVIRRHIRQKQALEAATETKVDMPGRFRGQKPKKPKGPFKF